MTQQLLQRTFDSWTFLKSFYFGFFKNICNKHFENVFKMFGKNVMF